MKLARLKADHTSRWLNLKAGTVMIVHSNEGIEKTHYMVQVYRRSSNEFGPSMKVLRSEVELMGKVEKFLFHLLFS